MIVGLQDLGEVGRAVEPRGIAVKTQESFWYYKFYNTYYFFLETKVIRSSIVRINDIKILLKVASNSLAFGLLSIL